MENASTFVKPVVMEGHGAYNRNSQVQASGSSPAVPMLERAAGLATIPEEPQQVVIADYGSSEGHNSLALLQTAIKVLRQRIGQERAISVVHTDLPENDFTVLFRTLNTSSESYLKTDAACFASAVGRSFYEQILPSDSVTLGWSSWAVQWLSRAPTPIPDQVQVAYCKDAAVRSAFFQQAAEDWDLFLTMRARELCPGGRLAILTMATDDNGDFGYRGVLDAMYEALVELVDCGFILGEELHRMAIPTVGRSRRDLLAPFGADGRFGELRVEEAEVFFSEDHIWLEFEQQRDAERFGAQWAAFSRTSVFPTMASSLDGGGTGPRAAEFFERLERGMAARLAAKPEPMLIPLGRVLVAKAS